MSVALSALTDVNGYSKKNLEAMIASVTAATKGAETLGAQAMAYSKSSIEGQVAAAKSLAGAKSIQEVVELQTAYAKSALETYMAEVGKMSETVAASVKDSLKPLNERVPVYQKTFTLVQDVVLDGALSSQAAYRGKESMTIAGTLEYQACDDKICFNQTAIPVSWTIALRPLDTQRAGRP